MKSSNYKMYERGRLLNEIREIRNALVHDFDMNKDNLLDISDKTISILEKEIIYLTNPKRAKDIYTPFDKLCYAKYNDKIEDIIKIMLEKGFLQFPIMDDYKHLIGVISPNTLLLYISKSKSNITKENVFDLKEYIPLDKHISEHYMFVNENALVSNIGGLFDKLYESRKRLAMVFVTKDGKSDQPLLGVITPYDILKLDSI